MVAFKIDLIVVLVCIASVNAGFIAPGQITIGKTIPLQFVAGARLPSHYIPLSANPSQNVNTHIAFDSHPQYKYGYSIQDSISGDSKSQVETRDGNKVSGEYSLIDADGFKRIVQYTSDSINGFNAVVTRTPIQGLNNVKSLVPLTKIVKPTELPYVSASAQEIDYDPVVKGAYAVKPIVRAVPIAYPFSMGNKK